jgi:hypothetical protein
MTIRKPLVLVDGLMSELSSSDYIKAPPSAEIVESLGFTPENAANKGQPNGYAGLGVDGRVPAAQLPSYVDDVLEFSTFTTFPNPGSAGVIYVALDTNIVYRWSGSTYVDIASSEVAWADVTGKPAFGTMSLQDSNDVNISGGQINIPSGTQVLGNLSFTANSITSTEANDDILISPTGLGAARIANRITVEDKVSFGPLDGQGSYVAVNAEYVTDGFLNAWRYLQNGAAAKYEYDDTGLVKAFTAPVGDAGDSILIWEEVKQIRPTWDYLVLNWSTAPVQIGTATVNSTAGKVFSYALSGVTRYRFVPDTYNSALDSFYETYSGGNLSGLIVSRGVVAGIIS